MRLPGSVEGVVSELAHERFVNELVVFGSHATGLSSDVSDVDLLVVHDPRASSRELRSIIRNQDPLDVIDPIFFTPGTLEAEFQRHPSFAAHIADQGVIVHQRGDRSSVHQALEAVKLTDESLNRELDLYLEQLRLFTKLDRFNNIFSPCLAQLYSLGRSIVIVKLLERGRHEYGWRNVFQTYSNLRPDLSNRLEHLHELRKYYEHVHAKNTAHTSSLGADKEYVENALDSIAAVAAS